MVQSVRPQDASGVYRRTLGEVAAPGATTPPRGAAAPGRARRSDSVALSEQAQLLARSLDAVEATPDIRADLVQQLRTEVNDGTYRMNVNQIAARMLQAAAGGAAAPDGTQP